jgi:exodeoxyribonuclease VII small subunit
LPGLILCNFSLADFIYNAPFIYTSYHLNIFIYMPKKKSTTLFEDSLAELEQLVSQMEQGDISLEESLKSFERGVTLTRTCQKALQEAEQKVQILIEKNGTQTLEPFTDE